jgi:hypothetical protein
MKQISHQRLSKKIINDEQCNFYNTHNLNYVNQWFNLKRILFELILMVYVIIFVCIA